MIKSRLLSRVIAVQEKVIAAEAADDLPNVAIVGMGGKITSTALSRDLFQSYGPDKGSNSDILQRLQPEISKVADVNVREVYNISSAETTSENLYNLCLAIDDVLADENVDGVIVNAVTNIMEKQHTWYLSSICHIIKSRN
jgi:L-asparaginase